MPSTILARSLIPQIRDMPSALSDNANAPENSMSPSILFSLVRWLSTANAPPVENPPTTRVSPIVPANEMTSSTWACQRSARSQSDISSSASRKPCPGNSGTTTEKPSSNNTCAIARMKKGESLKPCTSTATFSLFLLCKIKGAFPSFRKTLLQTPNLFNAVSRHVCVCPHSLS